MKNPKNILICPLDWGIGHATRCVPIIKELVNIGHTPVIAADNRPLAFLQTEFPDLKFIRFGGYQPNYPQHGSMAWKMLCSIPKIIKGIKREHREVKKIIRDHNIDILISDNRYGLWNKETFTVFITHQLMVKLPYFIKFFEPLLNQIIKKFINKYDECWIPDMQSGQTLSGDLSHKYPLTENSYFIGPLTRFRDSETQDFETRDINDVFVILSGPEPQRSKLEEILFTQLKESTLKAVVVQGITEKEENLDLNERIKVFSHLPSSEMLKYFQSSSTIICRPGYSSIMDIVTLGKKAIFIPTPGQTEQEYLADFLMKKKMFYSVKQSRFSIGEALKKSESYSHVMINPGKEFDILISQIVISRWGGKRQHQNEGASMNG